MFESVISRRVSDHSLHDDHSGNRTGFRKNAAAQANAGKFYKNGTGVPQDLEKALKYYRSAISQGNHSAMNNLAVMYEDGVGVPQDLDQAIYWYKAAAERGNPSAPRALERLKESYPERFA